MRRGSVAPTLFWLSAAFIVYATTIPWDFSRAPDLSRIHWLPLWDSTRHRIASFPDMVQNVALFFPFGLLGWLAWPSVRRHGALGGVLLVAIGGFALSLLVETLQIASWTRTPSATDLATNTLGALLGAVAGAIYTRRLAAPARTAVERTLRDQPGLLVCLAFLLAIAFGSLAPFLPSLDVSALKRSVRAFLDDPWGPKPWPRLLTDALSYAALGLLVAREVPTALWRRAPSAGGAVAFAILAVTGLAAAFECAQFLIQGHSPGVQDAVAGLVGGTIGAMFAPAVGARPGTSLGSLTRRAPVLVLGFALLAPAVRALQPFEFQAFADGAAGIDGRAFVPFAMLFSKLSAGAFLNVFEAAAFYLPLGYALAALGRSPRAGFVLCLVYGLALEVAQIPVAGRTFDVTEGLYAGAMALVGAWLLHSADALSRGTGTCSPPAARTSP